MHNNLFRLKLNPNSSGKIKHISDKLIRNVKYRIFSLPMHVHKHQLYLFEQHSFNIWSSIIRINTEGKSLIMKLGHGHGLIYSCVCNTGYKAEVSE